MSKESLQDRVDRVRQGETLTLDPPLHEFKGPVILRKPIVIDGQGGTIWAVQGPVVRIESSGVILQNLAIELTSRDATLTGDPACALCIQPGLSVDLDHVSVRGTVVGLASEEGTWAFPTGLTLGSLRASTAHTFQITVEVPVECKLVSDI